MRMLLGELMVVRVLSVSVQGRFNGPGEKALSTDRFRRMPPTLSAM